MHRLVVCHTNPFIYEWLGNFLKRRSYFGFGRESKDGECMFNRKKVVLFGTGKVCLAFMQMYDQKKIEILGLCDNNKWKHNTYINGYKIYAPSDIDELGAELIVITTSYCDEVKEQLLSLGCQKEKLLNFYPVYKRLQPMEDDMWLELLNEEYVSNLLTQNEYSEIECLKELQRKNLFMGAKNLIRSMPNYRIKNLEEVEFQVYSQFGEDGIIQWLIQNVYLPEKTFIEFGVEDYAEANTRFLLMNNNWSGLVIDGSKENIKRLMQWELLWKYDLTAIDSFITKDNINQIITDAGFGGNIGILSVDIDGNDYWVLNAIECVKPRILICEYNNIFGKDHKVTIPYDSNFYRTNSHYSNLYWGASLGAFLDYADKKGYYYFGSNSAGNNAFFVRKDSVDERKIPIDSENFVESKIRESRDERGKLTYLRNSERLQAIKDMPIVDLSTGKVEHICDIYHI